MDVEVIQRTVRKGNGMQPSVVQPLEERQRIPWILGTAQMLLRGTIGTVLLLSGLVAVCLLFYFVCRASCRAADGIDKLFSL